MQNDFQIVEDHASGNENVLVAQVYDADIDNTENVTALLAANQRRRHIEMLCIATVIVICAAVFQTPDGHHVTLPGMAHTPFPEMCFSKAWFGVRCPGCGLTRSFISMMHGQWQDALAYNRIGPILFLCVLLQFPYRAAGLLMHKPYPLGRHLANGTAWLLICLLLGNWVVAFFI